MSNGQTTATSRALTRREVYSDVILDELKDQALPEGVTRDISDFPDGSVLFVTTFGEVVIKEVSEGKETPIDKIDTGEVTLEITEHEGAGVSITDEARQDANKMKQLDAALPGKMLRGLQESYETKLLQTGEVGQNQNNANQINGFAHRFVATGAGGRLSIADMAYVKLSMQKANAPDSGIIGIVDPIDEYYLNLTTNITALSDNPQARGIVETGFAKNFRFIRNFFGVDLYVSNRLPRITDETINAAANGGTAPEGQTGATQMTNGHACVFMNVTDDMVMPFMSAWRQRPEIEYDRNVAKRQDEYYMTTRYGFGVQRPQSLVTILTSGQ